MLSRPAQAGHDRVHVRHAPAPGNIAATRPAGPPPRRRDRRRRAAPAPAARRAACQFECRRAAGARPRPGARDRRHGVAPARQLASSDLDHARARAAARGSPGRSGAAHRRGATPVARRAGPRRGRSVGPSHAGRPARIALFRSGQRRAAAPGARRRVPAGSARRGAARHAGMADAQVDRALRRGHGARHRGRARAGAGARYYGKERSRRLGGQAQRPRAGAGLGAHGRVRSGFAASRL